MKLVAILNAFDIPNAGGVQVSARIAWGALQHAAAPFDDTRALLVALEPHTTTMRQENVFIGTGRLGAIRAARAAAGEADVALFWHLDLLKLMPLLRLGANCRKIVFLHGVEAWRPRGAWTRHALGQFHGAFCNTSYTLQRAAAANPVITRLNARVVHLGLGVPAAAVTAPDDVPAAVMIARLHAAERYKGHEEVLAAWPLVRERIPDAQLWIAGDGDLRPALEERAQSLGLQDAVRFFGRVSESEKQMLITRARCLLLPSTGEGFGLVYLEAMRAARPCLTGVDGGREVINPPEAGLAVTHRTRAEIANAALKLMSPGAEWQHFSEGARVRYEQQFTAQHFGTRLIAALADSAIG